MLISIDYSKPKLQAVKTCPGKPEERKELLPGPRHLAVCTWDDGNTYEADVPNLLLTSREKAQVLKRPAAKAKGKAKAKKGKAKATAEPETEDSEVPSSDEDEDDEETEGEVEAEPVKAKPAAAHAKALLPMPVVADAIAKDEDA